MVAEKNVVREMVAEYAAVMVKAQRERDLFTAACHAMAGILANPAAKEFYVEHGHAALSLYATSATDIAEVLLAELTKRAEAKP